MRSQRLQKGTFRNKSFKSIALATDFRFSRFEFMDVDLQQKDQFTRVDNYEEPENTSTTNIDGVTAVQEFSETLKYMRRTGLKGPEGSTFVVDLAYAEELEGYKCVRLVFNYISNTSNVIEETAEIQVFTKSKTNPNQKYQLTIKNLNLDSDVTEYLFRFTKGLEWNSETYAILDCNPNLSVNKGIYLTMNVPFESNIAWGVDKRKLIIAYKFTES